MAQRKSQGFRPTPKVAVFMARREAEGERKTDAINKSVEGWLDAFEGLGAYAWQLRREAEEKRVPLGTLLARYALAGLKGAKR